jgi:hypothetical protein
MIMTDRWLRASMNFCSVVIFTVLAIQLVVGFVDTGRWGWPFIAYPMYKTAHYDGERLDHDRAVYAILRDSQRVQLTREQLGMDFWMFYYNVVVPIVSARHRLRSFAGLMCARFEGALVALEVTDVGVAISRDGPVIGLDPVVLATASIACQREDRGL